MYLAWVSTLAASTLLATSPYWRSDLELTFAFLLMLAFVLVFFSSLIRRIHNVRAIEEERARVTALQELATVRCAFLAKVSHELRSPLQSIVSALASSKCGTHTRSNRMASSSRGCGVRRCC
jgi:K+-sensing histidine kinase KdpD